MGTIKIENCISAFTVAHSAYTVAENDPTEEKVIEMREKMVVAKQFIQNHDESLGARIVRCFLAFFGVIVPYQGLLNNIKALEERVGELSPQEKRELEDLRGEEQQKRGEVGEQLGMLVIQFKEIKEPIRQLEQEIAFVCRNPEQADPSWFDARHRELENIRAILTDTESFVAEISKISHEDRPELAGASKICEQHRSATERLDQARKLLISLIEGDGGSASPLRSSPRGGIRNGGNTCYLASAIQTIAAIPTYRRLFELPLVQREDESNASFEQRKKMRESGNAILTKILAGTTVERAEINDFRRLCLGQKIVPNSWGPADGAETLAKILRALDYMEKTPRTIVRDIPEDSRDYVRSENQAHDANDYLTVEQKVAGVARWEGVITVNGILFGKMASMQKLIDVFWASEKMDSMIVKRETGAGFEFVEYSNVTRTKEVDTTTLPDVLQINAVQDGHFKASISDAELIYPAGGGKGPAYRLRAVIEHQPGHYVAHIATQDGYMIEANDSQIKRGPTRDISGLTYYYVKVKE